jgi:RND superfamily putative drug exporter
MAVRSRIFGGTAAEDGARMFYRLGRFAAAQAWLVCLLWLAAGAALACFAPSWDTRSQDDDVRFVPDRFTSVRAYQLMEQAFPQDVSASRIVFAVEREDGPLEPGDYALLDQLARDLEQLRIDAPDLKIMRVESHQDGIVGMRLVSADRQCSLVNVSLGSPYLAVATQNAVDRAEAVVKARLAQSPRENLNVFTTGAAGIGRDLTKAAGSSLDGTTWATILLVVVVLLGVYRAPLMALVPLLTIAFSVWVSLNLLAMMTLIPGVHLVNISKIFAIVILYGAGTDYCLFLVSRYREELESGWRVEEAIARSVGGVGEALAASAGTVMVGLGLMGLAEFAKVRCAGPAIALSLGVALLASLTLTPALLRLMGRALFWPGKSPSAVARKRLAIARSKPADGFWDRVSHAVVKRPILTWFLATAVLLPLVFVGMGVKPNYRATSELNPRCESLQGLAAIQKHFTAGETGPITVLLTSTKDWASPEGQWEVMQLSLGFRRLPGVAEVRSLTQPLGSPIPVFPPILDDDHWRARLYNLVQPTLLWLRETMLDHAEEHYISPAKIPGVDGASPRNVTRLDIVLDSDPFDAASVETLQLIQLWLKTELPRTTFLGDVQSECFGVTSTAQDLAEVTESDRVRVNGFVLAAIFAILVVLVRRLWLAGYLLVTVLGSYYSALGATVLMGYVWTGQPLTHVDWRVPFFLFTILVAVGEDYNILLMSRAIEERKKYGPIEGMRRALAKTGGAITSCGLIMAGTFATLMLARLNTLVQVGFALAFGVLVDTFIVRPFLVPSIAIIFWGGAEPAAACETPTAEPAPRQAA